MHRMPTDFRDGKTFPRRGRDTIGDAMWLARISDKARAAAAGTIYDYVYPCPMDQGVLARWKVPQHEFEERSAQASERRRAARVASRARPARRYSRRQPMVARRETRESRSPGRRRGRTFGTRLMGSMIEVTRPDGKTAPAYHAPASKGGDAPGIVLFEEWWGLDDRIKATADRLASENFNVIVPDLYRGRHAATGDEANHLMQGLDFGDAATQDGAGAARYLRERGAKHVGVMGFCMGGALAMLAVMDGNRVRCREPLVRLPAGRRRRPSEIRVPLQGHWALHDTHFTIEGVEAIEERLKAGNVPYEFHRYDAQHGFYNARQAGRGRSRTSSSRACGNGLAQNRRVLRSDVTLVETIKQMVPRARIERATPHFSGACSTD